VEKSFELLRVKERSLSRKEVIMACITGGDEKGSDSG
jgi:hypothetical protein